MNGLYYLNEQEKIRPKEIKVPGSDGMYLVMMYLSVALFVISAYIYKMKLVILWIAQN